MLGFILSTLAFSYAVVVLDRQLKKRGMGAAVKHKLFVALAATLLSIAVGWAVDEVDGDADLPQKKMSFSEAMHSGDAALIAGKIIGYY